MAGANAVGCAGAATFDSASVGAAKTVTVTDLVLTGPAAAEFTLRRRRRRRLGGHRTEVGHRGCDGGRQALRRDDERDARKLYAQRRGRPRRGRPGLRRVHRDGHLRYGRCRRGQDGDRDDLVLTGAAAATTPGRDRATTTASIQPRTVTPTVTVTDKRYDGTTSATIANCVVNPRMGTDAVALYRHRSLRLGRRRRGQSRDGQQLTLTGAAAPNYVLATTATTTTATIHLNRAPIVTNPGEQSSFQGGGVVVPVAATDPDGDPLIVQRGRVAARDHDQFVDGETLRSGDEPRCFHGRCQCVRWKRGGPGLFCLEYRLAASA